MALSLRPSSDRFREPAPFMVSSLSMSRLIVLAGPMGSGKTTIGRLLASRLGIPMVDSDQQLIAAHDVDARGVAEVRGVAALHEMEAEALLSALERPGSAVIAAAASIADRDDLVEQLSGEDVFTVLLGGDPDMLLERSLGASHRRDLSPEERVELSARRAARLGLVADLVISVDEMTPEECAQRIEAGLKSRG